ncbi:hypothetical protein ANCDUO_15914 [Ancylostoma duodenale]|uniref:Uncharacterized protein n=1 Tax=Ancylostoma duodenale TaxID=51022 RepID=A0A0C2CVQ1_9BILA|nr:hypothetical protein ANCDUO_15914 [Ancylostoma duodenale]
MTSATPTGADVVILVLINSYHAGQGVSHTPSDDRRGVSHCAALYDTVLEHIVTLSQSAVSNDNKCELPLIYCSVFLHVFVTYHRRRAAAVSRIDLRSVIAPIIRGPHIP